MNFVDISSELRFWPHLFFARSGMFGSNWVDDDSLFSTSYDDWMSWWEDFLEVEDVQSITVAHVKDYDLTIRFSPDQDFSYLLTNGERVFELARQGAAWRLPGITWDEAKTLMMRSVHPEVCYVPSVVLALLAPMTVFATNSEAEEAIPCLAHAFEQLRIASGAETAAVLAKWWADGMTDKRNKVIQKVGDKYDFFPPSPRAPGQRDALLLESVLYPALNVPPSSYPSIGVP